MCHANLDFNQAVVLQLNIQLNVHQLNYTFN